MNALLNDRKSYIFTIIIYFSMGLQKEERNALQVVEALKNKYDEYSAVWNNKDPNFHKDAAKEIMELFDELKAADFSMQKLDNAIGELIAKGKNTFLELIENKVEYDDQQKDFMHDLNDCDSHLQKYVDKIGDLGDGIEDFEDLSKAKSHLSSAMSFLADLRRHLEKNIDITDLMKELEEQLQKILKHVKKQE